MGEEGEAKIPLFGARGKARELADEVATLRAQLEQNGSLSLAEVEARKAALEARIVEQTAALDSETAELRSDLERLRQEVVVTEETAVLQEVGIYEYRHPLSDAVAYEAQLKGLKTQIKEMTRKGGGAVLAATNWTVNNSASQGRTMVRDFSKLMLRAYNAEADNLVRGLKPYKLEPAIDRLTKAATTIVKRQRSECPWCDQEKARLREERKAQQEMERERARLDKERQHYENALAALEAKGDQEAAERMRADQIGMTRRLDPKDRIRELSDASVPFNFDVHALFFAEDAVLIEAELHRRLAERRVNRVNMRREFFYATPAEVKEHLLQVAGDILEYEEQPEALEFHQSVNVESDAAA